MPVPQIILFLDSAGTLRAEAPGQNGARRKIELPLGFALANPELLSDLKAQQAEIDLAAKRESDERKRRVAAVMLSRRGQGRDFANKTINDLWVTPTGQIYTNGQWLEQKALREALKAEQKSAGKPTSGKSKPRQPSEALEIDLSGEL